MTYKDYPCYLVVRVPQDIAVGPFSVEVNQSQYDNLNINMVNPEGLPVRLAADYQVTLTRAKDLIRLLSVVDAGHKYRISLGPNVKKMYFVYMKLKGHTQLYPVIPETYDAFNAVDCDLS